MAHLVIAEDDPKQSRLLRLYVESEGHSAEVVADGRAALESVRRHSPDLLVLDVMLPRVDGLDVCRILRTESDVPILMLTARSTEDDILLGLDLGADDYVVKPFSPRQLMARIRALLRHAERAALATAEDSIEVGDLHILPARYAATYGGEPVAFTPSEFTLLETLAREPGRVFSRDQLTTSLHGRGEYISRRTIDTHVSNLRRKLSADVERPVSVRTVHGVGYSLVG